MKPYVREEKDSDVPRIRKLVSAAFGSDTEAVLVERLRDADALKVSMVLISGLRVIAHASVSPMSWMSGTDQVIAWALAPVSVQPELQLRGFGTQIVQATIDRCRKTDAEILTVLGSPKYYARFGFNPAAQYSLAIDGADFGDAFMVLELTDGALSVASGQLKWHSAFDALSES